MQRSLAGTERRPAWVFVERCDHSEKQCDHAFFNTLTKGRLNLGSATLACAD